MTALSRRGLQLLVLAIFLVLGVAVTARQWDEIQAALSAMGPIAPLIAMVPAGAGIVATFLAWRVILRDLGSFLPLGDAARIYYLSQLGKYLPGSVWAAVAQVEMARAYAVPRSRSAAAYVVSSMLTIGVGGLVGLLALPALLSDTGSLAWWQILLPLLLLVLVHPAIMNPLIRRVMRLLRRPPLPLELTATGIASAAALTLAAWLLFGASVSVLVFALDATGTDTVMLATGAYAVAFCLGFLAVIAPAGAGVREAALIVGLAPILDVWQALAVALVSRVVMTVCDLAAAAISTLSMTRSKRRVDGGWTGGGSGPLADGETRQDCPAGPE